jgi:hypothetical protein
MEIPPEGATPVTLKIAVKSRPVVGATVLAPPRATPADKPSVSRPSAPLQAGPFTRIRSRHSANIWGGPDGVSKTLPVKSTPAAFKIV